ncbi:protein translocase subunit SecD [Moheibacter sediminis]|uniref:Multifunctional fusion protein n=1 Tax=Moheibacter sediminis TaxID=1434700 RepID=A0A1W1Z3Y3_9FLAO|nr:protein translocase subunit SecD [Moheibacter sediminis]SMC43155.1 SecD/SecF fusion protein [Moheibacter sediminis]
MRGKWLIAGIAIILGFLCIRQLSYTWYSNKIESDAKRLSKNAVQEQEVLDSLAKDTLNLGIIQYNYQNAKEKELKLGLDLKGGINVILQVQVRDLLQNLANNSQNPVFNEALDAADITQRSQGGRAYVDIFFEEFEKIRQAKNQTLPYASPEVFGTRQNAEKIKFNDTDEVVKETVKADIDAKIGTAYQVISSRIDQFGVVQPVVQRLGSRGDGRILVELPGVKDTERVKRLLQSTAKLEFWKVEAGRQDVVSFFYGLTPSKFGITDVQSLQTIMQPSPSNSTFVVQTKDTAVVNKVLKSSLLKAEMPSSIRNFKYFWANKTMQLGKNAPASNSLELYVLSGNAEGNPLLGGDAVKEARGERNAGSISNEPIVSMQMTTAGARDWGRLTTELSQKGGQSRESVAIVLDHLVYSAPSINEPILGGNSQISGNFTLTEAQDLANILQAGSLPASAKIVQAEVVGPSLGQEAINSSLIAFVAVFVLILVWMIFYYSQAGVFANIALVLNILFLLGIMVSMGATLSLPGIAGVILTIAMAIDANIIINERVKDELFLGKNIKEAVSIAYSWKGAISAIVDTNVTSILTAIILLIFGKGPVQGFATTLIIGLLLSMFTAIFLTRYFVEKRFEKNKNVSFYTSITKNWFQGMKIDFMSKRKMFYIISIVVSILCIASLAIRGLDLGIDFQGGRTYTVRFEKPVNANDVAQSIEETLIDESGTKYTPEVKIFGPSNQVKITTKYKAEEEATAVDDEIKQKIYNGVKTFLPANMTYEQFSADGTTIGILSSVKVGPTIASDITRDSIIAVVLALLGVGLYILFRFKWQYGVGIVAGVAHDVIVILGLFSLFKGVLPFNLEIDQAFIAAILTVIGYSLNDSVVIFDRIREYIGLHPKMPLYELINNATNNTLSRTINNSISMFLVILIIFIFGGETIKGFMFAMLIGVIVGTYSSIYISSQIMYDLSKNKEDAKKI